MKISLLFLASVLVGGTTFAADILSDSEIKEAASSFQRYVLEQMTRSEGDDYLRDCALKPPTHPFCAFALDREELDARMRAKAAKIPPRATGSTSPRVRKKKLMNWLELRFSPVATLISGLSTARPSELHLVREKARREKSCPNNAAVAVAAVLEDQLREGVRYDEVARLYAKGGDCLLKSPSDRENLLTRAGLLFYAHGDYKMAIHWLARASTIKDAFASRSLYWLHRAWTNLGETARAKSALEKLQLRYPFSFHTLVALAATNRDPGIVLKRATPIVKTRSVSAPKANSLVEAVELLHKHGFAAGATKVLDWAVAEAQSAEPEFLLYLAELKREQGDYHGKILLLSDLLYKNPGLVSRATLELYFPKVFFPIFEKHAAPIDPYLLLAIARRESAFRAGAISTAKAQGLLQVLPSTARRIAGDVNLTDPDTNVEVGAKYVNELLRKSNGQIHYALAAYNAGPRKLTDWMERYPIADPILFIDLIAYRETREYVASVLRNYYWYRRIHQNDDKMTTKRLLELATAHAGP